MAGVSSGGELVFDLAEVDPDDSSRFGGKGTGLARMVSLGFPVPPAFVISTDACRAYRSGNALPEGLLPSVEAAVARLEQATGKVFAGRDGVPLLVAVRSGAKVSMPGMMDTILNLGLDVGGVARLADLTGDPGFAVDIWVRFWTMFLDVVFGIDADELKEQVADEVARAVEHCSPEYLGVLEAKIVSYAEAEGVDVPMTPREQLVEAVTAVFRSWDSPRAKVYRAHHSIDDDLGTAVVVQSMVFGNLGQPSGSGVAFTRNPITGEPQLYGEYLEGRQGEEVVAGTATPVSFENPDVVWAPILAGIRLLGARLEAAYRDALDIEFTVENGRLFLLQTRPAKRTAVAEVRIAADLVREGVITPDEALARVSPDQVRHLLRPEFDPDALEEAIREGRVLAHGVGASPGHVSGAAVLDADRAAELAAGGAAVILVRPTTSPQDLRGMLAAQGIVTAKGGSTSHAAVVARALDKPCVVGCESLSVDAAAGRLVADGTELLEGAELSIDGASGMVLRGVIPTRAAEQPLKALAGLLDWADERSKASIWLSVAGPGEAAAGLAVGVAGIAIVTVGDVLIGAGEINQLIRAIEALGRDVDAPTGEVEGRFEQPLYDACRALLVESTGMPVDLRVPNLASPRARRMIAGWSSLAPQLMLPLGAPRLLRAYVRAVSAAARDVGHDQVTLLIGGVVDGAELAAFVELARGAGDGLGFGGLFQNPAVLYDLSVHDSRECPLWVDVPELVRSTEGLPSELALVATELRRSTEPSVTSRTGALPPLLEFLLPRFLETVSGTAARVGADLGGVMDADVVRLLYRMGFRHFASRQGQAEGLRLLLGQASVAGEARAEA